MNDEFDVDACTNLNFMGDWACVGGLKMNINNIKFGSYHVIMVLKMCD